MQSGWQPEIPAGYCEQPVQVGEVAFRLLVPAQPGRILAHQATASAGEPQPYVAYWSTLWPAAVPMAEAVLRHRWTPGTRTIELGCGVGLVGLAGWQAGLDVLFTDYDADAVRLAVQNAHRHGYHSARGARLDWREPCRWCCDVVLASDVLYDELLHAPLLQQLDELLSRGGTCWIGDPGRPAARRFYQLALDQGWTVTLQDEDNHEFLVPRLNGFQRFVLTRELPISVR